MDAVLQSYRGLIWFWAAVLSASAAGAVLLEAMGPPPRASAAVALPVPRVPDRPRVAALPGPLPPLLAFGTPSPISPRKLHLATRRVRAPAGQDFDEAAVFAERDQSLPPPSPAAPAVLAAPAPVSQGTAHYIGVYTTGADGVRTFRSVP